MVKFVVDGACDTISMEGVNLSLVPLTIYTDERTFVDDENLDVHDMLNYLASYNDRSYTACPGIDSWLTAFEGGDEIYVLPLTSGLSGTYNSAIAAREIYLQDHPEAQIHVFDTLTAGPELRLLLEKLVELKEIGQSFDEICYYGANYLKTTRLFFAFESLHNFAQNGRVSKVVAAATNMLGIRVLGTASPAGTIEVISKCRGEKKTAVALMKELEKINFNNGKLRIVHTENPKFANELKEKLTAKYPEADITVYESRGICSYYGEKGAIFFGAEAE